MSLCSVTSCDDGDTATFTFNVPFPEKWSELEHSMAQMLPPNHPLNPHRCRSSSNSTSSQSNTPSPSSRAQPLPEPVVPIRDPRCAICFRPATQHCSRCKSIAYCSPACQTTDFPSHKLLCRAITQQRPRPSPTHVRAIYFAEEKTRPELIWIDVRDRDYERADPQTISWLGRDRFMRGVLNHVCDMLNEWKTVFGSGEADDGGLVEDVLDVFENLAENPRTGARYSRIVQLNRWSAEIGEKYWMELGENKCLDRVMSPYGGDESGIRGSVVALAVKGFYSKGAKYVDVDLRDFRRIVDFCGWCIKGCMRKEDGLALAAVGEKMLVRSTDIGGRYGTWATVCKTMEDWKKVWKLRELVPSGFSVARDEDKYGE